MLFLQCYCSHKLSPNQPNADRLSFFFDMCNNGAPLWFKKVITSYSSQFDSAAASWLPKLPWERCKPLPTHKCKFRQHDPTASTCCCWSCPHESAVQSCIHQPHQRVQHCSMEVIANIGHFYGFMPALKVDRTVCQLTCKSKCLHKNKLLRFIENSLTLSIFGCSRSASQSLVMCSTSQRGLED